jgi:hypothetical protein
MMILWLLAITTGSSLLWTAREARADMPKAAKARVQRP